MKLTETMQNLLADMKNLQLGTDALRLLQKALQHTLFVLSVTFED